MDVLKCNDIVPFKKRKLGQKSVQKISDIQCSVGGPSETETNLKATYIIYMVWTAWPLSS